MPRSRGGQTTWVNVVAACLKCNLFKGQPHARGGAPPAHPRAGAPAVPVLHAPAEASARHVVPRLVAQVPGGRSLRPLSGLFKLVLGVRPLGDQPRAIDRLAGCSRDGQPHSVLLGITGSGKTFTLANVIARLQRPALVISPNKTLAAQLYSEFKSLLPRERRRVLRLVLRLLPAGGLHPAVGHLYREGRARQRRDRPHAPLHDGLALRAARRGGRGLGVVHLRHRGARDLSRDARAASRPARSMDRDALHPGARGHPVRAQRLRFPARARSGSAATWSRSSPSAAEAEALRVEFWGDSVERLMTLEPAQGHHDRRRHGGADLPRQPLRDAGRAARAGAHEASATSCRERLALLPVARAAARGPAARAAHALRHGDAAGDRLLPRRRELLAPSVRPQAGAESGHA